MEDLAGLGQTQFNIDLKQDRKDLKDIERSIVKSYRKHLWIPFIRALNEYDLVSSGDKIALAISGGKDSLLMSKLFQELKRYSKVDFDLEFIAMDPGYSNESRAYLEDILAYLDIPCHIYDTNVFDVAENLGKTKPCYMCARMRRGALYAKAQELGCNKLALGHHYDDVIETILLNVLCSGNFKTMMPKLKARNFENMELIRPIYLIEEKSIISWIRSTGIRPLDCACTIAVKENQGKRAEIKALIKDLETSFDNVRSSIFKSAENVDIGSVLAWKYKDLKEGKFNFLDDY